MKSFRVIKYSSEALASELSFVGTSSEAVQSKNHYIYLNDYLGSDGLSAKQMVVEEKYISKDFLSDYTSYYATCFYSYGNACRRIHFFSIEFTDKEFGSE